MNEIAPLIVAAVILFVYAVGFATGRWFERRRERQTWPRSPIR